MALERGLVPQPGDLVTGAPVGQGCARAGVLIDALGGSDVRIMGITGATYRCKPDVTFIPDSELAALRKSGAITSGQLEVTIGQVLAVRENLGLEVTYPSPES